jgi:hypothetical protein
MIMRMPAIEERESEHDTKEELDRKEREYQRMISKIESDIYILRGKREMMIKQNEEQKGKMVKREAGVILGEKEQVEKQLREDVERVKQEAQSFFWRNEVISEIMAKGSS